MRTRLPIKSLAALLLAGMSLQGCRPKEPKGFYETIAGWDIQHVPIIPPVTASSTYPGLWMIVAGRSIHQDPHRGGALPVLSFGVSKNYVYGATPKGYTVEVDKWFLLNTHNLLYAEYDTEAELLHTLGKYKLAHNPIRRCDTYFDQLARGERCYWFPEKGKDYPRFPDFRPDSCIDLRITGDTGNLEVRLPERLTRQESKIYYFKIQYDKADNDLLYVSFDTSPPVLIRNGEVIQAYAPYAESMDIAVFIPYDVAEQKGIGKKNKVIAEERIWLL